jgi:hypothetical protein
MIITHHVNILMDKSTWHFDPSFQDKVWDKLVYMLVTRDIDMKHTKTPFQVSEFELNLPAPTPETFIPFDQVEERDMTAWIDALDDTLVEKQRTNTFTLMRRFKLEP